MARIGMSASKILFRVAQSSAPDCRRTLITYLSAWNRAVPLISGHGCVGVNNRVPLQKLHYYCMPQADLRYLSS